MNKQQQQARLEAIKKNWEQRRQIGRQLQRIKTKLGVYSGKGGVGKTTVAVNLAAYELQDQFGVSLSTPKTHEVETRSGNSVKTSSKEEITGSESSS